ncbi:MAG: hypothetical protein KJ676_07365 [Alphaproteobacteria bacterium]|nr:hypothetical protein [Alphaproteobacteria bacterium]MBU1525253.1 hypothetical protein [Alphaproteobacteria bacterium]MBU2116501.1 hypothetical protein [Alphaproteobacteria bacterium]MBU2351193.1 hypothetical protein [Alphaproteobacteria bacterium]MBU2382653.1 hypothetical protein [Alphaproteobacteria bacterium]
MVDAAAQPLLFSLLASGFGVAFLHAILPTHWLPFVLVGRAQRWRVGMTMTAVVVAGLAHIVSTALVGGLIALAGLALEGWISGLLPWLSAALLFAFGLFYLIRAAVRRPALAGGPDFETPEPGVPDRTAFLGLIVLMAVSPGEVLLPLYLSSADQGLAALGALTVAFAAGTILGMGLFTALARAGASILKLERWARFEGAVLGVALIGVGLLVATRVH